MATVKEMSLHLKVLTKLKNMSVPILSDYLRPEKLLANYVPQDVFFTVEKYAKESTARIMECLHSECSL